MKDLCLFLIFTLSALRSCAQSKKVLSLEETIRLAQAYSPSSRVATTQKQLSNFQFITYQSELKPQVSFYGNAPVFNKEYMPVRQPDGTITYQSVSQNNSNLGISLNQRLGFSGGEISLNSDLSRFDDFKLKSKQYNGTPIYISLSQPLFSTNELKWDKRIEPLKLESAKRLYAFEMQDIAQQAVTYCFDVLDAQVNMDLAQANLKNTNENFQQENKRVSLGTTSENKLLQLQLQILNSQQAMEKARYEYEISQLNLKSFIGYQSDSSLLLVIPDSLPSLSIDVEQAYQFARKYRPEFVDFEVKRLEALKELAKAKSEKQEVNLVATYGLNNAAANFGDVYRSPNDQQRFSLGFNIPIMDWGRRRARYNTAKAIEKLTMETNQLSEISLMQEITTLVKNIELLQANIIIARQRDTLANKRFLIATQLYQTGSLTLTDLILAQTEKDNAAQELLSALRSFWISHYTIRKSTLYDFELNVPLLPRDDL